MIVESANVQIKNESPNIAKPVLGAVASTAVPTKPKTFFVFIFFSGAFKPFKFLKNDFE